MRLRLLAATLAVVSGMGADSAPAQEMRPTNRVSVLVEGYVKPIEGREPRLGVSDDGARRIAGTVVLVQGETVTLVSDPGMVTDRALILEALEKRGVAPEAVTHVFISHHHPDHTVNIALFPNAELVDFWATYEGDVWEDHGDEYEVAPGIRVVRTPGHTDEDASLVVETDHGTYVLTHLWAFADIKPGEDDSEHKKKMLQVADWIIPGHGPKVRNPLKREEP